MQLACKTALLKHKGRQMVKQLVQHGANLVRMNDYYLIIRIINRHPLIRKIPDENSEEKK
jgi:hypothetical protein